MVTFRITDEQGQALNLSDLDAGSVRFTIARIDLDAATGLSKYTSYITGTVAGRPLQFKGETRQPALASALQPVSAADSNGTFVSKGGGVFAYTFVTMLPADFPRTATHTMRMQATKQPEA